MSAIHIFCYGKEILVSCDLKMSISIQVTFERKRSIFSTFLCIYRDSCSLLIADIYWKNIYQWNTKQPMELMELILLDFQLVTISSLNI